MSIHIAYIILAIALITIGCGRLETWQRVVTICAFALATVVLWVVN